MEEKLNKIREVLFQLLDVQQVPDIMNGIRELTREAKKEGIQFTLDIMHKHGIAKTFDDRIKKELDRLSSPVEPEVKPASAGLLPCPFCGGKGYRGYDPEDEDYSVYCTNCGAIVFGTTKEEIETKWNRRLSV